MNNNNRKLPTWYHLPRYLSMSNCSTVLGASPKIESTINPRVAGTNKAHTQSLQSMMQILFVLIILTHFDTFIY